MAEDKDPAARILLQPGLEKHVLHQGPSADAKPREGALVTVHYELRIASGERNGQLVESSRTHGTPHSFKLGVGHVIQGFDLGVASMAQGDKCKFYIAPALGYANIGCLPLIPPNVALTLEVELLSFEAVDVRLPASFAERIAAAAHEKEQGNALVKSNQHGAACSFYLRGLRHLQAKGPKFTADEQKQINATMAVLYLNLAACKHKVEDFGKAVAYAAKSFELSPSAKALYRQGQALLAMKDFERALKVAEKALALEPNDKAILDLVSTVKAHDKKAEGKLWGGMFARQ